MRNSILRKLIVEDAYSHAIQTRGGRTWRQKEYGRGASRPSGQGNLPGEGGIGDIEAGTERRSTHDEEIITEMQ